MENAKAQNTTDSEDEASSAPEDPTQKLDERSAIHDELLNALIESIQEIFPQFAFTELRNMKYVENQEDVTPSRFNAYFVMSSNNFNCLTCFSFGSEVIKPMVTRILGDDNPTDKDCADAILELSNIIYGGVKKRMQYNGYTFGLGIYEFIDGKDQPLVHQEVRYGYLLNFTTDLGEIVVKTLYDTICFEGLDATQTQPDFGTIGDYVEGYFPMRFVEIVADQTIDFNLYLYLRLNQKILLYKKAGDLVEHRILNRFANFKIQQFYVKNDDQDKFINYVSKRTAAVIKDTYVQPEVKEVLMQQAAHGIISGFFDDAENREYYLNNATQIVRNIVVGLLDERDPLADLFKKIHDTFSVQSHSTNVQTFSMVLAMALGQTSPKALSDIGVGALFHDIGYSELDEKLLVIPECELTVTQRDQVETHPQRGIEILNRHKVDFSYESRLIIQQHHENYDGSGYPKKLTGFRIYELAQIVSLADDFDLRYNVREASKVPPEDILKEMWKELNDNKKLRHDPRLFKRIFGKLTPKVFLLTEEESKKD